MTASTLVASLRRICLTALLLVVPALVFAESEVDMTDPFDTATKQATKVVTKKGVFAQETIASTADPFEAEAALYDPFNATSPIDTAAYFPESPVLATQHELVFPQPVPYQTSAPIQPSTASPAPVTNQPTPTDPCARAPEKNMSELGIDILLPSGLLPKDYAALCWAERNAMGGPYAAARCWGSLPYFWEASCLCYRPLYFEEINLERHGYGCCKCIQPAVSAAHFFGTIPCLPYCMAEHCPCQCEYTLGHYRPGSCPPWRHHWPSCQPLAAAAEAGVVTGLIFAIP